jgi:hypothetical protein
MTGSEGYSHKFSLVDPQGEPYVPSEIEVPQSEPYLIPKIEIDAIPWGHLPWGPMSPRHNEIPNISTDIASLLDFHQNPGGSDQIGQSQRRHLLFQC